MLETKVQERTYDLSVANEEISKALKDLQETQTQLVESEKMASLGQLTAGVAHEINNPINFVSANIKPLERDFQDILSIIQKYDESTDENVKEIINKYKRELDFDYLKEEIFMLLKGIQEGANRTVEIVHSLRNFSRLDEQDLKRADVHDGIDSTLVLLNSSMGGMIHVNKQYGDIPEIDCYPGKLNQVFMNILSNSVYAIKKKFEGQSGGELTITTTQDESNIQISIRDNGTGMPKEVMSKIFDPFYTSKPVGEGTGLGLSIVYKIIENHKGNIQVDSKAEEWTEFIITLPKYSET
jgi:two-component system, NtrC family, sensor kinase